MKLSDLHPVYQDKLDYLREKIQTSSLWQKDAAELLLHIDKREFTTDEMLGYLHDLKRVEQTFRAGLENNQDFRDEFESAGLLHWFDYSEPPVDDALQRSLADKLYNLDNPDDVPNISIGDGSRKIGAWLVERCIENGHHVIAAIEDARFGNLVQKHADEDGIKALAADFLAQDKYVTKSIASRGGTPEGVEIIPKTENRQLFAKLSRPAGDRRSSGEVHFTLTEIPTRKDAEIDGMDYDDYIKLFFEMCDQPWGEDAHPTKNINAAHQELIGEFNAASTIRITNNDGTDVTMDLVDENGENMTFANSIIARNVPGSEIFSAPRRDSVNGTVVAKGKFVTRFDEIVEDLTLTFENGKLVDYDARAGKENFEKVINTDDGAMHVGELGIGTNPHLKRHVANGLLVEKIGGSFHLALGAAYTMTKYMGDPVRVDNGNRSAIHWDITTMLYGKEGKIYLDDRLVMDNGVWLDPKYDVLNRGWASIDKDDRPEYWKDYKSAIPAPKPS
jgi:aminopeptidase